MKKIVLLVSLCFFGTAMTIEAKEPHKPQAPVVESRRHHDHCHHDRHHKDLRRVIDVIDLVDSVVDLLTPGRDEVYVVPPPRPPCRERVVVVVPDRRPVRRCAPPPRYRPCPPRHHGPGRR